MNDLPFTLGKLQEEGATLTQYFKTIFAYSESHFVERNKPIQFN